MRYYPRDAVVISKVENGFFVTFKGTRESQEDNMDDVMVFNDIDDMIAVLKQKLRTPPDQRD